MAKTPTLNLHIIRFDDLLWHQKDNDNMRILDAAVTLLGIQGITGVWANSTSYSIGNQVLDTDNNTLYQCFVTHTSAATGTFAADRAANPTYWSAATSQANWRGDWTALTYYAVGDFVQVGHVYYYASTAHTSSALFASDSANWEEAINFTSTVDAVADADAFVTAAEAAQTAAETAQTGAETAQTAAETAQTAAETAQTGAETAQTGAETAQTAAEAAQAAAEDAASVGQAVVPVLAATTTNITLSGEQTIDGVSVVTDDRVLVRAQTTASENGIYIVSTGAWTRAAEGDEWYKLVGAVVSVSTGTLLYDTIWLCLANDGGTLNTTDITFGRLSLMEPVDVGLNSMERVRVLDEYVQWKSQANINMQLDKAASGDEVVITGSLGGTRRWATKLGDDTIESGSETGSYYKVIAYNDDGTVAGTLLEGRRSDLRIVIGGNLSLSDGKTISLGGRIIAAGEGDPNGVIFAGLGSIYMRSTGVLYLKTSGGSGNTGWTTV